MPAADSRAGSSLGGRKSRLPITLVQIGSRAGNRVGWSGGPALVPHIRQQTLLPC